MFVRKVALLPEKLLPLRYFKWRRRKDLWVGLYPFLKVPQLLPQEGLGESAYPMIKGQREQKNGWGALTQAFTQLTFQPWTPSDTGNTDYIAEKVKEAPSESANPTGWKLSAVQARTLGGCSCVPKRLCFLVQMHWAKQDWWPSVKIMLKHRFCNTHQEKNWKDWEYANLTFIVFL